VTTHNAGAIIVVAATTYVLVAVLRAAAAYVTTTTRHVTNIPANTIVTTNAIITISIISGVVSAVPVEEVVRKRLVGVGS